MNVPSTIFLGKLLASLFGIVTKCVTLIFKKVLFGQPAIVSVKRWIYHFLFRLPCLYFYPFQGQRVLRQKYCNTSTWHGRILYSTYRTYPQLFS